MLPLIPDILTVSGIFDIFRKRKPIPAPWSKYYTDDELIDMYDVMTRHCVEVSFDDNDEPLPICYVWERIIDTFYDSTEE